ncbi:MAG: polysaccharide deacetylase family protein [Terriglobales bacterium]
MAAFHDQIRLLDGMRRRGAVRVVDLAAWWSRAVPSRPRPVILCFDDGCQSDFEVALPLLREFGFPATFFINTAAVARRGFMDWPQIRALVAAGMQIGSHGHEHVPLCRLPLVQLVRQLRHSRQQLQDRAGASVDFLAPPYGLWNRRVRDAAFAAGFRALVTSRPGTAAAGARCLPRNALSQTTSLRELQDWLEARPASLARRLGRHGLLWLPKQILLRTRPD